MTIGERIKLLRKELGLNQSQFAEKIGLKQAAIGLYENNQRGVSDHIRLLISEKYNVSEDWLRTGKGAMFMEINPTIITQLADEYELDSFEKALISGFLKLKPEQRSILKEQAKAMLREVINNDGAEELLTNHNLKPKQNLSALQSSEKPDRKEDNFTTRLETLERENAELRQRLEAIEQEDELLNACDYSNAR